jgi:hypothetical protein
MMADDKPKTRPKKKLGRKSVRTPELADKICGLLVSGKSLRSIGKMDGMPDPATVLRWVADDDEFCRQYDRACEQRAEAYAEEIMAISDDCTIDARHKRIMVDSRKWIASKLKSKRYGDKIDINNQGGLTVQVVSAIPDPPKSN